MLSTRAATPPAVRGDTGTLPGDLPSASVGDGSRALVVLPGGGDSMFHGAFHEQECTVDTHARAFLEATAPA